MTLTKIDKSWIQNILEKQELRYESKLESKLEDIEEKFEDKIVEFKSDFFEKVDPVLKEVTTSREERTLIEERVEKLEELHPNIKHSLAV